MTKSGARAPRGYKTVWSVRVRVQESPRRHVTTSLHGTRKAAEAAARRKRRSMGLRPGDERVRVDHNVWHVDQLAAFKKSRRRSR